MVWLGQTESEVAMRVGSARANRRVLTDEKRNRKVGGAREAASAAEGFRGQRVISALLLVESGVARTGGRKRKEEGSLLKAK